MEEFDKRYSCITSDGRLNFIGAIWRYFDTINQAYTDETQTAYIKDYNQRIFPIINCEKAIGEYSLDDIEDLIAFVQKKYSFNDTTIQSRISHLIYDPYQCWVEEQSQGSIAKTISNIEQESAYEEIELLTVKSLNVSEEKRAAKVLLSNPKTSNGEDIGLALMLLTALRNNEACGLNFGDLKEMIHYPGCYYLQITKTTQIESNKLKIGGKTYNAFRRLPVINKLKELLVERKIFVEAQVEKFPYIGEDGITYHSIDEMPIVCRSNRLGERASTRDLTNAGSELLRNKINMHENAIDDVIKSIEVSKDTIFDLGMKDVTTYLLRRNMATHLYTLGFTTIESQYFMGHKIENTEIQRVDFGDEDLLYSLWLKLQKHPLNETSNEVFMEMGEKRIEIENESEVHIRAKVNNARLVVKIRNKEQNDRILVKIDGTNTGIQAIETHNESREHRKVINIVKEIKKTYEC